jgi:hypothetical protein
MHRAAQTVLVLALSCEGKDGGNGNCAAPETLYADEDGDGHGTAEDRYEGCDPPSGYVPSDDDCDDGDGARSPSATEHCNAIDDDCDDLVDDDDPSVLGEGVAYADRDDDGFGAGPGVLFCDAPDGFVDNAEDCDDEAVATHPGAVEVCGNDLDENCDTDAAECRLAGDVSLDAPDLALVAQVHSAYKQFGAAMTTLPSRAALVVAAPGDPWSDGVFLFEGLGVGSYDEYSASATLTRDDPYRVLGTSLAGGDVDGDGEDDLVIAAPLAWAAHFAPSTDEVYVELGPVTTHAISGPVIVSGDPGFAHTVSCTGDFDGDGFGDVAIGSPLLDGTGSVAMFLGGSWSGSLDRADADVTMTASSDAGSGLGTSIGHADLDGDGRADLVIGAPTGSGSVPGSGVAYVRLGTTSPDIALSFPTDADGGFLGTSLYDGLGTAVGAGDLDADDAAQDVWVGAPGRREAYVFAAPSGTMKASDADVTLAQDGGTFGAVGDLSGDVNGDGHPDLLIGDPLRAHYAGAAHAYFTPTAGTPDASLWGASAYTWAGSSLAVSDLTRDGYDDVFVGAPYCTTGGAHGCVAGLVGGP